MIAILGHVFVLSFLWAAFHPKLVALFLELAVFGAPPMSSMGWIHVAAAAELVAFLCCAWSPLWRAGYGMTACVGIGYIAYATFGPSAEECGCLSAWGLVTPAWSRTTAGVGLLALGCALIAAHWRKGHNE